MSDCCTMLICHQTFKEQSIYDVCNATLVSYLTYAIVSWWGLACVAEQQKLQGVLNRAVKWEFYNSQSPSIEQIYLKRSSKLFSTVLNDSSHVLHQFLPPEKVQVYDLRPRAHNR